MPAYKKTDILGIATNEEIFCDDCYDGSTIKKDTEFITEDDLQDYYFICDECGECL